jgi:hypothetical protein
MSFLVESGRADNSPEDIKLAGGAAAGPPELRFFGGLTIQETAALLVLSHATVLR